MISLGEALKVQSLLIEDFGGTPGIRDQAALEAALERPRATFEGKDLYPTVVEKSAALAESIIKNHPFIDGNKRLGYVLMRLTLMEDDIDIVASEDSKYDFILAIAQGELDFSGIVDWIKARQS